MRGGAVSQRCAQPLQGWPIGRPAVVRPSRSLGLPGPSDGEGKGLAWVGAWVSDPSGYAILLIQSHYSYPGINTRRASTVRAGGEGDRAASALSARPGSGQTYTGEGQ